MSSIYYVKVHAYMPYKIEHEYTFKTRQMHTAVARAIRQYRKENHIAGRRLDAVNVQVGRAGL